MQVSGTGICYNPVMLTLTDYWFPACESKTIGRYGDDDWPLQHYTDDDGFSG